jgi:rhodanese-related sulfurtransferase
VTAHLSSPSSSSGAARPLRGPSPPISSGLEELDSDRRLIVFAGNDGSGEDAVSTLRERGFDAALAEGGIHDWTSQNFRTQPTEDPDEDTELGAG